MSRVLLVLLLVYIIICIRFGFYLYPALQWVRCKGKVLHADRNLQMCAFSDFAMACFLLNLLVVVDEIR